jgi:hypothetical protein
MPPAKVRASGTTQLFFHRCLGRARLGAESYLLDAMPKGSGMQDKTASIIYLIAGKPSSSRNIAFAFPANRVNIYQCVALVRLFFEI